MTEQMGSRLTEQEAREYFGRQQETVELTEPDILCRHIDKLNAEQRETLKREIEGRFADLKQNW